MIIRGKGANGKSVLMNILETVLGPKNCTSLSISSFCPDSFALSTTYGKLANLCTEMGDLEKIAEQTIKSFVSGDTLMANVKFKQPFPFRPSAKLTFTTNAIPPINDKSDGIWRRVILINLEKQFLTNAEQDKRLMDMGHWEKEGEFPGIMNRALSGLFEALERGHISDPKSCSDAVAQFRFESDTVAQFAESELIEEPGAECDMHCVIKQYTEFNKTINGKAYGLQKLSQFLADHFQKVGSTAYIYRKMVNGRRSPVLVGMKLRSDTISSNVYGLNKDFDA